MQAVIEVIGIAVLGGLVGWLLANPSGEHFKGFSNGYGRGFQDGFRWGRIYIEEPYMLEVFKKDNGEYDVKTHSGRET